MNQSEFLAWPAEVWVCVAVGRCSVSRPARVADADMCHRQWMLGDVVLEIDQFSGLFAGFELPIGNNGDSSRVITAVFEATKPTDQNIYGCLWPNVANDSTHRF